VARACRSNEIFAREAAGQDKRRNAQIIEVGWKENQMTACKLFSLMFSAALFCALMAPSAVADQWNQATKLTFSGPVEVPGRVLSAGTYWFTLMNDDTDRNIVEIWNTDRTQELAMILTVPDYRLRPTGKTVLKFEEQPSNQPDALEAGFYPGDNYGHEFVYPQTRARELAKQTGRPVLSMRDDMASNITKPATSAKDPSVVAMKHAQVGAMSPNGQEVDAAAVVQSTPQK
jgi:hypothetical protein